MATNEEKQTALDTEVDESKEVAKAKAKAEAKAKAKAEELVETVFMKDNDKYKDDIIVGLNGVVYRIKRGVKVKVPRAVMDIIDQSNELNGKAADMQESASTEANFAK